MRRRCVATPEAYREQEAKWCGSHAKIRATGLTTRCWNGCLSNEKQFRFQFHYPLKSFVICHTTNKTVIAWLQFLHTGWNHFGRRAFRYQVRQSPPRGKDLIERRWQQIDQMPHFRTRYNCQDCGQPVKLRDGKPDSLPKWTC